MAPRKKAAASVATNDSIVSDQKTGLEWSPTLGKRVNWKTAIARAVGANAQGERR